MRRGQAKLRKVLPDAIYGNNLISKLINRSMRDGKKSVAEKEIYRAFEIIAAFKKTDDSESADELNADMSSSFKRVNHGPKSAEDDIKEKSRKYALNVFLKALENIKPTMEVRPRRVGGAAYQVPMSVRGVRRESLAIRWMIGAANSRSNSEYHTYAEKLAAEIIDAAKAEGAAVKKRTDMERVAEANRAFAHFRW